MRTVVLILEKLSSISLEPSYISLSSQKTLKIKNSSDIHIKYSYIILLVNLQEGS
jgi:hypothetical protein